MQYSILLIFSIIILKIHQRLTSTPLAATVNKGQVITAILVANHFIFYLFTFLLLKQYVYNQDTTKSYEQEESF
jgi:hypothetical protein